MLVSGRQHRPPPVGLIIARTTHRVNDHASRGDSRAATRQAPRPRPGADPGPAGLIIDIDIARTEVVAVMPPAFVFWGPGTALWQPLPIDRETTQLGQLLRPGRGAPCGNTLAKLNALFGIVVFSAAAFFLTMASVNERVEDGLVSCLINGFT